MGVGISPPLLPPRPVPNLGYACLNTVLRSLKPDCGVFTSRGCIQKTMQSAGVGLLGELTVANAKDLSRIIQWNYDHGIRFFRMSSEIQPWMSAHASEVFPNFKTEIKPALRFAGDLARMYDQRLTFHPSHFVKLAAEGEQLVTKSISRHTPRSWI